MAVENLTDQLSVSGQLVADDIIALAAEGYSKIINNRPDNEEEDQPESELLHVLAEEHGLAYDYIPITPSQITADDVSRFAEAVDSAEGRVHAFCRSGMRSSKLWALSQRGLVPEDDIIEIAQRAGYDLSAMRESLQTPLKA